MTRPESTGQGRVTPPIRTPRDITTNLTLHTRQARQLAKTRHRQSRGQLFTTGLLVACGLTLAGTALTTCHDSRNDLPPPITSYNTTTNSVAPIQR